MVCKVSLGKDSDLSLSLGKDTGTPYYVLVSHPHRTISETNIRGHNQDSELRFGELYPVSLNSPGNKTTEVNYLCFTLQKYLMTQPVVVVFFLNLSFFF